MKRIAEKQNVSAVDDANIFGVQLERTLAVLGVDVPEYM